MLKEEALRNLEKYKKFPPKPKKLENYINLLNVHRKRPYFPAPGVIHKNNNWKIYELNTNFKLYVQFKQHSNIDRIATIFGIFPVDDTYGNLSPTVKIKGKTFALLEYELINTQKPSTGRD